MYKRAVVLMGFVLACISNAQAQGGLNKSHEVIPPLSSTDTVQAETSRTPKTTWLGKVEGWDKYEPRSFTVARGENAVQTLIGPVQANAKNQIDTHSFIHIGYTQATAPEIISTTTTRPHAPLAPAMKWSSQVTYVGQPADWCKSELKMVLDGSYEVEPEESFALRIGGKEMSLPVLPVVQRGTWKRCYSGKTYQRFLWSPDLQTVVAVEFQTYNPLGKLHEASFSMRVKEVQRGEQQ
ncbi:hypothetical protein [Limnohabitans sp.]|jgi:hypothetical protein|uniref:hypothetical protein n=1 Tax=Limnohabitans sp. TaxID=1907725 RepID=UPI0037C158E6